MGVVRQSKVHIYIYIYGFFFFLSFLLFFAFLFLFYLFVCFILFSFIFSFFSLSFGVMEALLSLILGPPLGFCFDLIPQASCGLSIISSSLKGRGGALRHIPCSGCGVLFF